MNHPVALKARQVQFSSVRMSGGLDQESPEQSISPGAIVAGYNHEQVPEGGYRRIDGYEYWSRAKLTAGDISDRLSATGLYLGRLTESGAFGETAVSQSTGLSVPFLMRTRFDAAKSILAFEMPKDSAFSVGERVRLELAGYTDAVAEWEITDIIDEQTQFRELRDRALAQYRALDISATSQYHKPLGLAAIGSEAVHLLVNAESEGFPYIGVYGDTHSHTIEMSAAAWDDAPLQDFCVGQFSGAADRRFLCMTNGTGPALLRRADALTDPLISNPVGVTGEERATFCATFANHLWISVGGSVFHSELGNEVGWDVNLGAGEMYFGETVTGMIVDGQALIITGHNSIKYITGTSKLDFRMLEYSPSLGATPKTLRNMPHPVFLDMRGVTSMQRSQAFSDFSDTMISAPARKWIEAKRGVAVIGSQYSRTKSQYRIFWDDKTALYITFRAGKPVGLMPVVFDRQFKAVYTLDVGAKEIQCAITENNYFKLDNGLGFAGEPIPALFALAYHHLGQPAFKKQLKRLRVDLDASEDNELQVQPVFNYGDDYGDNHHWKELRIEGGTTEQPVSVGLVHTHGAGTNISTVLRSNTAKSKPYTIHAVTFEYTLGARRR